MKLLILTKYVIKLIGQKFKFLCKLIGCEALEGGMLTINEVISHIIVVCRSSVCIFKDK